ncbi:MAG: hypothetical protein R2754_18520 [Microthrixaceae bacterium]
MTDQQLVEVFYNDSVSGEAVLTFDGHVVERFTTNISESVRVHASQIAVRLKGPGRKGVLEVQLTRRNVRLVALVLWVDEANYAAIQPVLQALAEAGVPQTPWQ